MEFEETQMSLLTKTRKKENCLSDPFVKKDIKKENTNEEVYAEASVNY